jgi:hypothetical protein
MSSSADTIGSERMNPARKACLTAAGRIWAEQPSLGLLEAANEVRVAVRALRDPAVREVPGIDSIRKWLEDAIAAGELGGPQGVQTRNKSARQRRKT